ncbi:MAG TPA: sulfotransferase [Rhizomicrobium sp.]|jgi:hypothetical protein|nr:sulfotransferase [Rhizomicrobium sp.]
MTDRKSTISIGSARQQFPFFIVGAQRSGTTLLRLILNAHSKIAVPEEARFLGPLLKRRTSLTGLDRRALQTLAKYLALSREYANWNYDHSSIIEQIGRRDHLNLADLIQLLYSSFAKSEGKILWGDKSLFFRHIGILDELFPHSSFIHIVRDGRDVFDSWRKMDQSRNHASTAALDWRLKLRFIEKAFAQLSTDRTLIIRYEDLLADPTRVIASLCGFLKVDFEEGMLSFHEHSRRYIGEHHSRLIFGAIDSANQSKWRKGLVQDELQAYDIIAGPYLEKFGYSRSRRNYHLVDYAKTWMSLSHGITGRAKEIVRDAHERRRALRLGTVTRAIKVGDSPTEPHPPGA